MELYTWEKEFYWSTQKN